MECQSQKQRWSTHDCSGSDPGKYWRTVLCDAVFELDVDLPSDGPIDAFLEQRDLGAMRVSAISVSAGQSIQRTRSAIGRSAHHQYELVTMLDGVMEVSIGGCQTVLKKGSSMLIDGAEPYSFTTAPVTSNLSFHIPAHLLEQSVPNLSQVTSKAIHRDTPWGKVILALGNAIVSESEPISPSRQQLYAAQLLGAISIVSDLNDTPNQTYRDRTYARALALLEQLAGDPDLDVQSFVTQLGTSPRYMHKLFAENGSTFGREILRIRLERAGQMLMDRRFGGITVNELVWRTGFKDESHFYKRFKTYYGCTPKAYRERALQVTS